MWQLFFVLIGFVFCSEDGIHKNMETTAGEDMNLECLGTSPTDQIVKITWTQSNGSKFFECSDKTNICETNTTRLRFGKKKTLTSSTTLTILNVSLVHEAEYKCLMIYYDDRVTCEINMTVNVTPKGLIIGENANDTILQNKGSITVPEGENKTLICKTNTQVKPAVNLEWVIPNELKVFDNSQKYVYDDHDKRLLVPTRTVTFTPIHAYGKHIVLGCKVASNSSFDHIRTSVLIKNEGERTTNTETLETGSKESHANTTNNGNGEIGIGTSYTTTIGPSKTEPGDGPWYKQSHFVIAGCSGVVMLLIVLAFVSGFIRSKKRDVKRSITAEPTDFGPSQGRRALPPTPSDQSHLPANHLPDQPPPSARLFRPVPFNPPDIPMRPLVPVSEDGIRRPAERTGRRMQGETFMTTDGSSPVTQAQKESATEMEYDVLNISHHGATGAVPHVYKETTNGLAEYAIVSRQQVDKRIDQQQTQRSKLMDDDSEYDLLNTWNQTEQGTVPHVYKETTNGLAEYAVVSKPEDKKKRQSLGPLTKVMKAPINVEAEYAVVDKSKKRAK